MKLTGPSNSKELRLRALPNSNIALDNYLLKKERKESGYLSFNVSLKDKDSSN